MRRRVAFVPIGASLLILLSCSSGAAFPGGLDLPDVIPRVPWTVKLAADVAKFMSEKTPGNAYTVLKYMDEHPTFLDHIGADQIDLLTGSVTPMMLAMDEYALGRAVAAAGLARERGKISKDNILEGKNPVWPDSVANHYVALIGSTLARFSTRPQLYSGYSFQILDSEEVGAFSTPGGHLFISRGMLRCCDSEDALAAVLAHEVAHIALKHGLSSINNRNVLKTGRTVLLVSAEELSGQDANNVAEALGGMVGDVAESLFEKGYSQEVEFEADREALRLLRRVGYDPEALVDVLQKLPKDLAAKAPGLLKTHPTPAARIERIRISLPDVGASPKSSVARSNRFHEALRNL